MLVDEIYITVKAGKGGPGFVSFFGRSGGPDGGDGGKGGDVYAQTTSDLYALNQYLAKPICRAQDGKGGQGKKRAGADGKDLILIVPQGTVIIDEENKEIELNNLNQKVLLGRGGKGGKGNDAFKSPSNTTPTYAQPGLYGSEKKLLLKLKLIADFGLVGLPNAGKSSLLNEITNAKAKIGDYPFTTLEPNLGVFKGKVIADIPGLIEGASEGRGLGHKFLKHIEKVHLILHCISSQSENPLKDYQVVHIELEKFNSQLLNKKEVVLLTKSDLVDIEVLEKKVKILKKTKKQVIPISIHNFESLQTLSKILELDNSNPL